MGRRYSIHGIHKIVNGRKSVAAVRRGRNFFGGCFSVGVGSARSFQTGLSDKSFNYRYCSRFNPRRLPLDCTEINSSHQRLKEFFIRELISKAKLNKAVQLGQRITMFG
jgi:hypothetical protein